MTFSWSAVWIAISLSFVLQQGCFSRLLNDFSCQGGSLSKDDNLHEMCRYGAAELHAVAAFIGKSIASFSLPQPSNFVFESVCYCSTYIAYYDLCCLDFRRMCSSRSHKVDHQAICATWQYFHLQLRNSNNGNTSSVTEQHPPKGKFNPTKRRK